jgi:hypothetical protein
MAKYETLLYKVSSRIARKNEAVFVREDFDDLGGYDQIGRILRELTRAGKIVKIGYGLYAKTRISTLTGEPILVKPLPDLANPTRLEKEYNEGKTTQVPTGRMIAVKGRISRKIGYKGAYVSYESAATA